MKDGKILVDKNKLEEIRKILKNIKAGNTKARKITQEDTYKDGKVSFDKALKAEKELIKKIIDSFFKEPPKRRYSFVSQEHKILFSLVTELVKTSENAFRLAEEGYYRSAFGELRDLLEIVMKIKLFYEHPTDFHKWIDKPYILYTTKDIREHKLFKESELKEEIKNFSNNLSFNRHCSSRTLDAGGLVTTHICYYRKDLFEKWCKHFSILKDLSIKIIAHK